MSWTDTQKGYALGMIAAINQMGAPVIFPPTLLDAARKDPDFAKLIDEGKIVASQPLPGDSTPSTPDR